MAQSEASSARDTFELYGEIRVALAAVDTSALVAEELCVVNPGKAITAIIVKTSRFMVSPP